MIIKRMLRLSYDHSQKLGGVDLRIGRMARKESTYMPEIE
jgi:hypothetical protein